MTKVKIAYRISVFLDNRWSYCTKNDKHEKQNGTQGVLDRFIQVSPARRFFSHNRVSRRDVALFCEMCNYAVWSAAVAAASGEVETLSCTSLGTDDG